MGSSLGSTIVGALERDLDVTAPGDSGVISGGGACGASGGPGTAGIVSGDVGAYPECAGEVGVCSSASTVRAGGSSGLVPEPVFSGISSRRR